MNKDLTYISVILDESSSMMSCVGDTIEGINAFIQKQAERPGTAKFSLTKFSTTVAPPFVSNIDIKYAPRLSALNYAPSGMTALYDAIGQTIDRLGEELAAMPEAERPGQVIVVIQTDGQENMSRQYSYERIVEMIKRQKDVYSWDFIFMGQGIDSFAVAGSLGINVKSTFDYGKLSSKNAFAVLDTYMTSARAIGHLNTTLSAADRAMAVTPDSN